MPDLSGGLDFVETSALVAELSRRLKPAVLVFTTELIGGLDTQMMVVKMGDTALCDAMLEAALE